MIQVQNLQVGRNRRLAKGKIKVNGRTLASWMVKVEIGGGGAFKI